MNSLTSSKPTIQSNQTGLRGGLAALVAASLLAAGPAFAGDPQGTPPSVAELLHQVETTVRTPKGYSAAIHQQVTRPSVAGARVAGTVEIMAEEDYALDCNEAGEARHVRKVSAAVAAVKRAEAKPGEPPVVRGGLMTVNPLKALEHVAALPATGVVEEDSAGVPCYKISAVDSHDAYILWVSKSQPAVRRLIIQEQGATLLDTTFTYKSWRGALVPSHVEITSPSNGVKMIHDYSGHAL